METMYASLLTNLGVYFVVTLSGPAGCAAAGGALIAATLTRPDHGLFYATMGLALVWRWLARGLRPPDGQTRRAAWRAAAREALAYAAPSLAYAAYLFWKYHYYGDIVPNTYYAKSVDATYWRQGLAYLTASGLSANLLVIAPLFALWLLFDRDRRTADFRRFAGLGAAIWLAYVVKVGGDFMIGRFLVVVMPLLLLGVERGIHRWARHGRRRPSWRAIAATALVAASLHGAAMIAPDKQRWFMADERTYYPVRRLFPVEVGHGAYSNGVAFRRAFSKATARPTIATSGVGMVGYYSRLPVVDIAGLNDPVVGRKRIRLRGRPGHEKSANTTYLDARGVAFVRWPFHGEERRYAWFGFGGHRMNGWKVYRYDLPLMARLAAKVPDLDFVRFDRFLDKDRRDLRTMRPIETARLLAEYDHYYFSLNPDPQRRRRFVDRFIRLWDFEDGCLPEDADAADAFADAIVSPAWEKQYEIEGYQGETLLATRARRDQGMLHLPPFAVEGDEIGFLMGGGKDLRRIAVILYVDGREVHRWTGRDDDRLFWVVYNVRRHKGRRAEIVLLDSSRRDRLCFDMFWEAAAARAPE
jgi:hypothetical protein